MRVAPASTLKGSTRVIQKIPREGTRLRRMFDLLSESKGVPIDIPLATFEGTTGHGRLIADLRDYYGLDIRMIAYGRWVLAGEWFGKVYVDYIVEHLAKLEREARQ